MITNKTILKFISSSLFILFFIIPVNKCHSENTDGISGRYINVTFLDQLPDQIPGSIPVYCLEINFTGSDSAEVYNGFEEYKLAYKKEGDHNVFVNAVQGKDLPFTIYEDGNLILADSIWTGVKSVSSFKKINEEDNTDNQKWLFEKYLNEKMISGDYLLFDNNNNPGQVVKFKSDGSVEGLRNYKTYSVCFAGDCTGETSPVSNTVTFKTVSNESLTFSFRYDRKNHSVFFYDISEPVSDIKGERKILGVSFELRKKNNN